MPTSAERVRYLDSSALVKLVVDEPESRLLSSWLVTQDRAVSCALARVEVVRAIRGRGDEAIARARDLLRRLDLVPIGERLLDVAAELDAPLGSLDAIHVAAAMELGDALDVLVTYDARMIDGARSLGLPVASPG